MTLKESRCEWANGDPDMEAYHDHEWGVPVYDDQLLFQKLILDGFQAGLSWRTILKKRDNFISAFDNFDPHKIVNYDDKKIAQLMSDKGIVRNRLKIEGTIKNARGYLKIREDHASFSDFLWQFVDHKTIVNTPQSYQAAPTETKQSQAMSKSLKSYGMTFVGPTICYAFMQAVGMVDDHSVGCFCKVTNRN